MARKLIDIEDEIKDKQETFIPFLKSILDNKVYDFIIQLKKIGRAYLFSGIIRDYFLGYSQVRDVDLMIDTDKDIQQLIQKYRYRRNSFGGYKVFIGNTVIDLWYLRDTWALHNSQSVLDIEIEKHIPNTAFFNFSSILFSFRDKRFIYTKHFLRFIRDKKIDYVFEPNANYALCVVNSFYYRDKLNLPFTDKLKEYLKKLEKRYTPDYESVQLKHFGNVIYSNEFIKSEVKNMVVTKRKKKRQSIPTGAQALLKE